MVILNCKNTLYSSLFARWMCKVSKRPACDVMWHSGVWCFGGLGSLCHTAFLIAYACNSTAKCFFSMQDHCCLISHKAFECKLFQRKQIDKFILVCLSLVLLLIEGPQWQFLALSYCRAYVGWLVVSHWVLFLPAYYTSGGGALLTANGCSNKKKRN